MTVKFLLKKCIEKLNMDDFTEKSSLNASETNIRRALIYALNAVYREIISEYLPFVAKESATVTDGKIAAASLSKQILYPISVERGGSQLDFSTDSENIYVEGDGKVELKYAYMPTQQLTVDDEINLLNASDSLLSDGMLAQYFLSIGMYDLAKSYDAVYRDRLWRLRYKNRDMTLKARRWAK